MGEDVKLGSLNEKEIEKIEDAIKNIDKYVPGWMVNHQKEPNSGKNVHFTGPDLDMANREDITEQQKTKSYRGIRHSLGLPVRGQRTRTSFRHGPAIGVSRKKEIPAKSE
jgi:small subunit ribosomal protein S13